MLKKNGDQMVSTLAFAFMCIYIFSVFSFSVPEVRNKYSMIDHFPVFSSTDDEAIPALDGKTNLFLYTLFHWDYGFREGPVFSHSYSQDAYEHLDLGEVMVGWLFNVLYYIFILLILTAVVSGIIIDSFAELRVQNQAIKNDIRNVCFVCDIDREDFERLGLNFKQHLKGDT